MYPVRRLSVELPLFSRQSWGVLLIDCCKSILIDPPISLHAQKQRISRRYDLRRYPSTAEHIYQRVILRRSVVYSEVVVHAVRRFFEIEELEVE